MKKSLFTIGEALIDMIPDKNSCPFHEISAFSPKVGGAPANVAAVYALLGQKATLFTALGEDEFGRLIEKELQSCGVDTSQIVFTKEAKTALAFVTLAEDGNRSFSFYRNPSADMLYAPENLPSAAFDDAFALHFCSVSLGDFPMKEAHKRAISLAQKAGALISFDPNLRFPLWKSPDALYRAVWEFLPSADILKISDEELTFITGKESIRDALDTLFVGKVKLLLYTRGKDGAMLYQKRQDGNTLVVGDPGIHTQAIDTTGAGDAFIGAFLSSLADVNATPDTLATLSLPTLIKVLSNANQFAALSTAYHGAIPSYKAVLASWQKNESHDK